MAHRVAHRIIGAAQSFKLEINGWDIYVNSGSLCSGSRVQEAAAEHQMDAFIA